MKAGTCLQQQFRKQTRKAFLYLENCHPKRRLFFNSCPQSEWRKTPSGPSHGGSLPQTMPEVQLHRQRHLHPRTSEENKGEFLKTQCAHKKCVGNVVFSGLRDPPHGPSWERPVLQGLLHWIEHHLRLCHPSPIPDIPEHRHRTRWDQCTFSDFPPIDVTLNRIFSLNVYDGHEYFR